MGKTTEYLDKIEAKEYVITPDNYLILVMEDKDKYSIDYSDIVNLPIIVETEQDRKIITNCTYIEEFEELVKFDYDQIVNA
jgi:hypothetical protein